MKLIIGAGAVELSITQHRPTRINDCLLVCIDHSSTRPLSQESRNVVQLSRDEKIAGSLASNSTVGRDELWNPIQLVRQVCHLMHDHIGAEMLDCSSERCSVKQIADNRRCPKCAESINLGGRASHRRNDVTLGQHQRQQSSAYYSGGTRQEDPYAISLHL
jgi:hypothetical protein